MSLAERTNMSGIFCFLDYSLQEPPCRISDIENWENPFTGFILDHCYSALQWHYCQYVSLSLRKYHHWAGCVYIWIFACMFAFLCVCAYTCAFLCKCVCKTTYKPWIVDFTWRRESQLTTRIYSYSFEMLKARG